MVSETELLRLCLLAYDAAVEPSLWPRFLEQYARAMNAKLAFLHEHDYLTDQSSVVAAFGYDGKLQASYHEHYAKKNLWRRRGRKLYRTGQVLLEEEVCPRSVTLASEFYNDYLKRVAATRSLAPIISRVGERALTMPALRAENDEPFGDEDRVIVMQMMPHLVRANMLREQLSVLQAGEEVLDGLQLGVLFLTGDGRVVFSNRAAEAILHRHDGLVLRAGILSAIFPASDTAVRAALQRAANPACGEDSPAALPVERRSASRPYQLCIAPLRRRFHQFRGLAAPSIVALVTDPDAEPTPLPQVLVQIFGLTRREAELASKLSAGMGVEQVAEELGMRYETARTHLRRIFDKTGTSRQAELVSLLSRIPHHAD